MRYQSVLAVKVHFEAYIVTVDVMRGMICIRHSAAALRLNLQAHLGTKIIISRLSSGSPSHVS